jgi:hypothetical protein
MNNPDTYKQAYEKVKNVGFNLADAASDAYTKCSITVMNQQK